MLTCLGYYQIVRANVMYDGCKTNAIRTLIFHYCVSVILQPKKTVRLTQ